MILVGVAGAKGALGVTTLTMALAHTLSSASDALLVEGDPDGGVLAARLQLSQEPGLTTLAAAGRHEISSQLLGEHSQRVGGLSVIVAPSSPSHVRAALHSLSLTVQQAASFGADFKIVIDLGRIDGESPALPLALLARNVWFLTTPDLEGADALAVRLIELEGLRGRGRLVTVGDGPYQGSELGQVLGIPFIGHLPRDTLGADAVWARRYAKKRRPLIRGVATLANELTPRVSLPSLTDGSSRSTRAHELTLNGG